MHARKFEMLAYLLISMNVITGAGGFYLDTETGQLKRGIAQKVWGTNIDFSTETTGPRPLINLRDEPLVGKHDYGKSDRVRLHIVASDAANNMSPWAGKVAVGLMELTVMAMEEGLMLDPRIAFKRGDWHKIAKQVAGDLTCREPLVMENGKTILATEVLRSIITTLDKLRTKGIRDELIWVLDEARRAVDLVAEDPYLLRDRGDWHGWDVIMKKSVAELGDKVDEYGKTGWEHKDIIARDLQWSRLAPEEGKTRKERMKYVGQFFRTNVWNKWMPDIALIESTEPSDNRSKIRDEVIRRYHGQRGISMLWDKVSAFDPHESFYLDDAHATDAPELWAFLERRFPAQTPEGNRQSPPSTL